MPTIGPATPNPWNNYLIGSNNPPVTGGSISLTALAAMPSYTNDAAAAAGGIAVGQMYRNGNLLQVRLT